MIEAFAKPFEVAGREIHQAASIGVTVQTRDGHAADSEEVLSRADEAMYRAKAAGKSRYSLFEGWMAGGHADPGGLERELRHALSDGQLATLFQRGARGPGSQGSGLGLHVSRVLMRQLGGDVQLRRHHGGATFALVLPAPEHASAGSRSQQRRALVPLWVPHAVGVPAPAGDAR